ncbi:hypothetical protein D3C80_1383200 [compost metagenome]
MRAKGALLWLSRLAASSIRHWVRYCMGELPTNIWKRSASTEREVPAVRASSSRVQAWAGRLCRAVSAEPTIRSPRPANHPVRPSACSFMYRRNTSMNSTSASLASTPSPPGRGDLASLSA